MTDENDWFAAEMPKIKKVAWAKKKLLAMDELSGHARCPCSPRSTHSLHVRLAPKSHHARAHCSACGFTMME